MITEDYASFEVAKLLKEKGFDEQCFTYYDGIDKESINRFDRGLHFNNNSYPWGVPYNAKEAKEYVVAPTHQMAMKWLREIHNICITIYPDKEKGYEAVLYDTKDNVEIILQSFGIYGSHIFEDSYEQAAETALKYSLGNLI